jgi:hypothetical protein
MPLRPHKTSDQYPLQGFKGSVHFFSENYFFCGGFFATFEIRRRFAFRSDQVNLFSVIASMLNAQLEISSKYFLGFKY